MIVAKKNLLQHEHIFTIIAALHWFFNWRRKKDVFHLLWRLLVKFNFLVVNISIFCNENRMDRESGKCQTVLSSVGQLTYNYNNCACSHTFKWLNLSFYFMGQSRLFAPFNSFNFVFSWPLLSPYSHFAVKSTITFKLFFFYFLFAYVRLLLTTGEHFKVDSHYHHYLLYWYRAGSVERVGWDNEQNYANHSTIHQWN